ncbi:MAG: hypothetical protein HYZ09_02290 [Candidatus Kerfeldbacteria bacterium]|nr:hypothetical protein [Candidatus Kerfeldbacteria bacterium]
MPTPNAGSYIRRGFSAAEWFLVFGLAFVIVYSAVVVGNDALGDSLDRFWYRVQAWSLAYGYFGAFVASLIGNAFIMVPVPYTAILFLLGALGLNPLLIGLWGGLGAAFGELTSYAAGAIGNAVSHERFRHSLAALQRLLRHHRRAVYGILFLVGATPIPDDLVLIPIGFIRFGILRTVLPVALGKVTITTLLASFGQVPLIRQTLTSAEHTVTTTLLTLSGIVLVVYALLKIDWHRVAGRLLEAAAE